MPATRWFPRDPVAVPAARHWLVDQMLASGCDRRAQDAALCISELAANALAHTEGVFGVSVGHQDGTTHISVTDESTTVPQVLEPGDTTPSGRGLLIVQSVSSRWGYDRNGDEGKTVWFDLDD
jgi:anti-sigma regulatory factor (Ser/Thr protein kinase)